jgi:hypothetical protein
MVMEIFRRSGKGRKAKRGRPYSTLDDAMRPFKQDIIVFLAMPPGL